MAGICFTPDNPLPSNPPPAPPCQGECPVCPSPDKWRLGGVGVEFLPNGQSGFNALSRRSVHFGKLRTGFMREMLPPQTDDMIQSFVNLRKQVYERLNQAMRL